MRSIRIIVGMILSFIAAVSGGAITEAATREEVVKVTEAAGYQVDPQHAPKSSIIIDAQEGRILWEQDPDQVRNPASMTKLLAVYLVFDAIKEGKFDLETKVTATARDQQMSELYAISNSKIVAGVGYPVRDLLKMVIVPSSNVATVMLADLVSKNDGADFIQRMNRKAQALGMENSRFYNCSGASLAAFEGLYQAEGIDGNAVNKTTARDLALMVYHLLQDHSEILAFTKDPKVTVMAGTSYEETFETYNYSLPGAAHGLEGVDGLKTGSGPDAAFNYVATAKRGDTRLIEVIMGVGDWSDQNGEYYRHPFGNALLEKAFDEYEYKRLLPAGTHRVGEEEVKVKKELKGLRKKAVPTELSYQNGKVLSTNQPPRVSEKIPLKSVPAELVVEKKRAPFGSSLGIKLLLLGIVCVGGAVGLRFWRGDHREQSIKKRFNQLILGLLVSGAVSGIIGILAVLVSVVNWIL